MVNPIRSPTSGQKGSAFLGFAISNPFFFWKSKNVPRRSKSYLESKNKVFSKMVSPWLLVEWLVLWSVLNLSFFVLTLFILRHGFNVGLDPHRKGKITKNQTKTPTNTPPWGARPTLSAQCGPICTRTPSQPRRPLPLALTIPVACSGERPFLHKTAQGCINLTLAVHEWVDSRFLVLPGSLWIFTEITGHKYISPLNPCREFKNKSE